MSAYDAIKDAVKLAQKADNTELIQRLLDAQQQALEMQEEVQSLRERVRELEHRDEIAEQLEYDDGLYWRFPEEGQREGPFCQLCWDDRSKLIRLQDYSDGRFMCYGCENAVYHDAASQSDSDPPVWRGR